MSAHASRRVLVESKAANAIIRVGAMADSGPDIVVRICLFVGEWTRHDDRTVLADKVALLD